MGKSIKFVGRRVGASIGQGKNNTKAVILYWRKDVGRKGHGKSGRGT